MSVIEWTREPTPIATPSNSSRREELDQRDERGEAHPMRKYALKELALHHELVTFDLSKSEHR